MWRSRVEAGRELARILDDFKDDDVVVVAIPRGGVVIGDEVAKHLDAPLDIVVPRKIGSPENPELALGAIAAGGVRYINRDLVMSLNVSDEYLEQEISRQKEEIERRTSIYRKGLSPLEVKNKTVILVDDGVATGATTVAAIHCLRKLEPKLLVLAVPVGPKDTLSTLEASVDRLFILEAPETFFAVGQFYEIFDQTTDQEVLAIMDMHNT